MCFDNIILGMAIFYPALKVNRIDLPVRKYLKKHINSLACFFMVRLLKQIALQLIIIALLLYLNSH